MIPAKMQLAALRLHAEEAAQFSRVEMPQRVPLSPSLPLCLVATERDLEPNSKHTRPAGGASLALGVRRGWRRQGVWLQASFGRAGWPPPGPGPGARTMTIEEPERRGAWTWRLLSAVLGAVLSTVLGGCAPARAGAGQPSPRQIGFQDAVTPIAAEIHRVHDYVNVIIIAITAFVLLLLVYVMWRFSEKRNPTPSRTTHNTTVEVLWTVIPVFILVAIAIPSFKLLFDQYTYPPPDLTIKAVGHTWNWTHEYPDQGLSVDSVMLQDDEREEAIKAECRPTRCRAIWRSTMKSWFPSTKWSTCWSPRPT